MAKNWLAKIKAALVAARDFCDEKSVGRVNHGPVSTAYRFAHFWLLVAKSFNRNRCPIRAAALSYTTLLALIPMLAVAMSVSSSLLKHEGEEKITGIVDRLVDSVIPPAMLDANLKTNGPATATDTNQPSATTNGVAATDPGPPSNDRAVRKQVADTIHGFIVNTSSAKLGAVGSVLLIFAAISMLSRIEGTFNDIWGVSRGRNWFARIVQYWAVITLGPLLLVAALGLASGPHLKATHALLERMPLFGGLLFHLLPVAVLCLTFALFYMLMPNTRVHWQAAVAGGLTAGLLLHLNNTFSVLYVSRVVTNSKIYGSLALVPVFMIGMYFAWMILLFGAQVAYAWQNRAAYVQDKQSDNINQRGREFIALRLMQGIGQRFLRGERPATVLEMADALIVPTRLVQQIMQTLLVAGLVVEVTVNAKGGESAFSPARPLETINGHDILTALRAGQGQELATCDDPGRAEMFGEYERILEAERKASSSVSVLAMAKRAEELSALAGKTPKAVTAGKAQK